MVKLMDRIPPKQPDYSPPSVKTEYKAAQEKRRQAKEHVTIAKKDCFCNGCQEIRNRPVNNAKVLFKDDN